MSDVISTLPVDSFSVEPVAVGQIPAAMAALPAEWTVHQTRFEPERANVYETQFTVGNGRFAARGSLEERFIDAVTRSSLEETETEKEAVRPS